MKVFLLFFVGVVCAFSQGNTGTIVGTITDPSSAIIPGVSVVVTNVNTGIATSVTTDSAGNYSAPYLQPGTYRVQAEFQGFKKYVRENVRLSADTQVRIDALLEQGQMTESVSVSGEAPLVQTETGALGTVIETRQVTALPLAGRNPQDLKLLAPGVVQNSAGDTIAEGGLVRKDPYYIDGAHSSNHVWSGTPVNPNPDVVQEVKVVTNSFSAEYGQTSGSVLLSTTRSGTNQFHGTLFEFFQNDKMNAGNYFTHQVPVSRFNQYGGTLGGPIKRNKTFFFMDAQLNPQRTQTVFTGYTVPISAFRQGNFSSILGGQVGTDALGRAVYQNQIFDPATARTVTTSTGSSVVVRDPFAGNTIPVSRLSPAALKLQSLFYDPTSGATYKNFNSIHGASTDAYSWDAKVDHNFSERDKLMARYSQNHSESLTPQLFSDIGGGGPNFGTSINNTARQVVLNEVHIFGARATNDLHLSYFRTFPHRYPAGWGTVGVQDFGINGMPNGNQKLGTPEIDFNGTGGFAVLGSPSGATLFEKQESFGLVNITSVVFGKHSVKFGGEARKLKTDNFQPGPNNGRFYFSNLFTDQRGFNNTGYDYASFLLGLPYNYTYEIYPSFIEPRTWVYALFAQDDFRVSRNLTVNIGLRWDAPLYWHEAKNRSGLFDLTQGQIVPLGVNGFRTTAWNQDYINFGPRFGFSYQPIAKTVIRGGYGLFSLSQQGYGQSGGLPRSPIFSDTDLGRFNSTDQVTWKTTLDNIPYTPQDKTGKGSASVSIYPDENKVGYFQQWNLNVQRELGGTVIEVGYAGSHGVHLPYGSYNLNAIPLSLASQAAGQYTAAYVPYPQYYGGVTVNTSIGSQYYHSLQAKAEKRFNSGLGFVAAYTFGKTMATGDQGYRDPVVNRNLDHGLEANSAPHRFTVAYSYALPFGHGRRWLTGGPAEWVLGGWELNGITTLQSGFPLTPTTSVNACNCGATNRPNVVRNPNLPGNQRSLTQWFDVGAFTVPANYTAGNAGQGIIWGPGTISHNANLAKRFSATRLGEGANVEFRGEFYNFTNTPRFANPNLTIGSATAGQITSTVGTPRLIQLALKVNF